MFLLAVMARAARIELSSMLHTGLHECLNIDIFCFLLCIYPGFCETCCEHRSSHKHTHLYKGMHTRIPYLYFNTSKRMHRQTLKFDEVISGASILLALFPKNIVSFKYQHPLSCRFQSEREEGAGGVCVGGVITSQKI